MTPSTHRPPVARYARNRLPAPHLRGIRVLCNMLILMLIAVLLCLVLLVVLVARKAPVLDDSATIARIAAIEPAIRQLLTNELTHSRNELHATAGELRREVTSAIRDGDHSAMLRLTEISKTQQMQIQDMATSSNEAIHRLTNGTETRLLSLKETLVGSIAQHGSQQRDDLERVRLQVQQLGEANEVRLDNVCRTIEERLKAIQATVDEELQETLEKRLGESFARVTERLEEVHKGLGEMRSLASGVGDLKRVLTNVKSRGGWGEVQLESLLEQMLSPEQYLRNASMREGTRECVEFAVKFPGKGDTPLLLPLDAKFPMEDYQDLVDAYERGEADAVEAAARRLEVTVKNAAKTIHDKYVNPPVTTEFAIMFLPTEGLYAEVLRRAGLADQIQRDYCVLIAGPTTLTAILNSLQMGFRTLAIEKRSSEVWRLLEAVKTEFGKFGQVVDKVDNSLQTVRNHIEALRTRSRVLSKSLKNVDSLSEPEANLLLKLSPVMDDVEDLEDEAATGA